MPGDRLHWGRRRDRRRRDRRRRDRRRRRRFHWGRRRSYRGRRLDRPSCDRHISIKRVGGSYRSRGSRGKN